MKAHKKALLSLETPHPKSLLTTPIGRLVETISYLDLIVFVIATNGLSTYYFSQLAGNGDGLALSSGTKVSGVTDSLYFSIVTFTSLGYGDVLPQGFGKVVASTLVLSGLFLIALLVGKIASERQYSMLFLLHSSDCQKRLKSFEVKLNEASNELKVLQIPKDLDLLNHKLKEVISFLETVNNYLIFHANQSHLLYFGNQSALNALFKEMEGIQKLCIDIFKHENNDEKLMALCFDIVNRIASTIKLMATFNQLQRSSSSLFIIRFISINIRKLRFKYEPTIKDKLKNKVQPILKRWMKSNKFIEKNKNYWINKTNVSMIVKIEILLFVTSNKLINQYLSTTTIEHAEREANNLRAWHFKNISPLLLNSVNKYIHNSVAPRLLMNKYEVIARELNISSHLAAECISKLKKSKRI